MNTPLDTLLRSDRQLSVGMNIFLLLATFSGVIILFFSSHSVWQQWNILAHLFSGLAFSLLALPYFLVHFRRTLGFRRAGLLASGLVLFFLYLGGALSGWHLLVAGQSEALRWVVDAHLFFTFSFLTALILHIYWHIRYLPEKRKKGPYGALPSVTKPMLIRISLYNVSFIAVLVLLTLFYPGNLQPQASDGVVASYQQAYGPHPFRPSQTETVHGKFVPPEQLGNSFECMACHADVGKQWVSSMHQQAASDPAYVKNITLLVENKGIAAARYCEGCHAPVALLSGELTPGGEHGGISGTLSNQQGVSCMSCHGIKNLPHIKGVASYEFTPARHYLFEHSDNPLLVALNQRLIKVKPDQHKADMMHDILKDPKVCASCHTQFMDADMNNWGWVKMQDEYGAWLQGPFSQHHQENFASAEYTRCQDCHMPLMALNDPSADKDGQVRSHHFPGAATFLPLLRGDTEHFEATKAFLQTNKMRLQIEPPHRSDAVQNLQFLDEAIRDRTETPYFYYLGELARIQLVVTNQGVGHNFPGGTIDINEAWVELTVTDASGARVYVSGEIQPGGDVDPSAYFYRSLPVDRQGKLVWKHDLFNRIGESFKRVIPAGESDIVTYEFRVPAWAKTPLTVTGRLRYRKLNNRYASWALANHDIEIPAIDMAWDSLNIPVKVRKEVTIAGY
ncbi:multiheme c-type cytochrome [Alteromonas halophila]|uniref:Cytochrome c-552/4 domain-containing protein n=1 Tax=Alteromonas halophila TaxID=516698 RepID=A0A918JRS3_9ALTE|nr:multiheme c-type cytochrome [Alteromonas halophila]GGW96847.1 hypothetical protein GCM10007391_33650 [Alteromonas halophila]